MGGKGGKQGRGLTPTPMRGAVENRRIDRQRNHGDRKEGRRGKGMRYHLRQNCPCRCAILCLSMHKSTLAHGAGGTQQRKHWRLERLLWKVRGYAWPNVLARVPNFCSPSTCIFLYWRREALRRRPKICGGKPTRAASKPSFSGPLIEATTMR
jgi:hypothetical protein